MLLNKVKSRQLTTWRTKVCFSCFPYGQLISLATNGNFYLYLSTINNTYCPIIYLITPDTGNLVNLTTINNLSYNVKSIDYKSRCQTDQQLFIVPSKPARQQHKYIITQHNILHHQKYCGQCHIYRPIRSIHCSACNHCVERYDHHCPWLSICIGKYNYKYFLVYLTSLVLLILISFIIGLTYTILISRQPQTVVKDFVIYMLIGLLAFIFLFPIGRLLIYHTQLIKQGITTNQQIKKTYTLINNQLPYQKLQYSLYREKRLPKFSYRLQKIKKLDIIKYQINQTQASSIKNSKNSSRNFQNMRDQRSEELDRMDRKNVFNSLIKNQHL